MKYEDAKKGKKSINSEIFTEIIDYLFKTKGYEETLTLFELDGIVDLVLALVDDNGCYDEFRAEKLVIDALNKVSEIDELEESDNYE